MLSSPLEFSTKILYAFRIPRMHATRPLHLILLDLTTSALFGEEYKLLR
jgi:hypothetical protein